MFVYPERLCVASVEVLLSCSSCALELCMLQRDSHHLYGCCVCCSASPSASASLSASPSRQPQPPAQPRLALVLALAGVLHSQGTTEHPSTWSPFVCVRLDMKTKSFIALCCR